MEVIIFFINKSDGERAGAIHKIMDRGKTMREGWKGSQIAFDAFPKAS